MKPRCGQNQDRGHQIQVHAGTHSVGITFKRRGEQREQNRQDQHDRGCLVPAHHDEGPDRDGGKHSRRQPRQVHVGSLRKREERSGINAYQPARQGDEIRSFGRKRLGPELQEISFRSRRRLVLPHPRHRCDRKAGGGKVSSPGESGPRRASSKEDAEPDNTDRGYGENRRQRNCDRKRHRRRQEPDSFRRFRRTQPVHTKG